MTTYILLFAAVVMNAFANICIKLGVNRLGSVDGLAIFEIGKRIAFNPFLILGVTLFVATLGAYGAVLSKMNLSIAYPIMTSLGFLIVTVFSALYLRETITTMQIIGLVCIAIGIWLTASAVK